MIGITVATLSWLEMAEEAAWRWTKHTGLPARIIEARDRHEVQMTKMSLESRCWFFDADLWFVRDVRLPELCGHCVFGTPVVPSSKGRDLIRSWARRAGADPACWISSGLYGADWNAPSPQTALSRARQHAMQWRIGQRDEESLNVGFQHAGLPVALLPAAYNWHPRCGAGYGYRPPGGILAIHAGDVPAEEKREFLERHTGKYR